MTREELMRECFVLICFLENINTNNEERVNRLLKNLEEYTTEKLKECYEINSEIKNIRVERFIKEKN